MSKIYGPGDDLVLPFIFVPHDAPEPPELAEFKATYPDWFAISAIFEPHEDVAPRDEPPQVQPPPSDAPARWGRRCEPPDHARGLAPDLAAASQAFLRASALHGDPVAALQAFRDSPEKVTDAAPSAPQTPEYGVEDAAEAGDRKRSLGIGATGVGSYTRPVDATD